MTDDGQLLRQYTRERSEAAFGELVTRHIDLVYAAALRVAGGDRHLAQDVAQTVFIDLARKAWRLAPDILLAGWLYRHTCFTAAKAVRTEKRRRNREQIALEMSALDDTPEPAWEQIAPHLDEGLNQLSAADRDAIVLRYLKRQDLRAVGATLGVSEDAAQKRVSRALEKLRGILSRRTATLTVGVLAAGLAAEGATAAPAGLAISVTTASLASAAMAGTGLGLVTLKLMAMTKLQLGIAGAILLAGIATPLVFQHQTLSRMRAENEHMRAENQSLHRQVDQMARLAAENRRLSNLVAQTRSAESLSKNQFSELLRLRGELTRLQTDIRTNLKSAADLSVMLKDPRMAKVIRQQQKVILSAAADKYYADLFAQLHLTPEKAAALKDLIVKGALRDAAFGAASLSGDLDGAKRAEQLEEYHADKEAILGQIEQLLGTDDYAQYKAYTTTVPLRQRVSDFEDQLASGPLALSAD